MGVRRYEDLAAWQRSMELDVLVRELTASGPSACDAEFFSQIRKAASKPAPLIAEGFVRYTPGEFARYLRMARGEAAEVQMLFRRAATRRYVTPHDQARATVLANRTVGTITQLLKAKLAQIAQTDR